MKEGESPIATSRRPAVDRGGHVGPRAYYEMQSLGSQTGGGDADLNKYDSRRLQSTMKLCAGITNKEPALGSNTVKKSLHHQQPRKPTSARPTSL
jgi:hypothetical protein